MAPVLLHNGTNGGIKNDHSAKPMAPIINNNYL